MKQFRVEYFVLIDHAQIGHTRERSIVDLQAETDEDAIALAQLYCSNKYKRVKSVDFKPGPFETRHSYPHADSFKIVSVNEIDNGDTAPVAK